jgi:hypothetical protein
MDASKYLLVIGIAGTLGACTTTQGLAAEERLEIYRAQAGVPVDSFRNIKQVDRWTALSDDALAVWTSATRGYLLELEGRCTGLESALSIQMSDQIGTVNARVDTVTPIGGGATPGFPCRIREIRPVDDRTVRAAENRISGA